MTAKLAHYFQVVNRGAGLPLVIVDEAEALLPNVRTKPSDALPVVVAPRDRAIGHGVTVGDPL